MKKIRRRELPLEALKSRSRAAAMAASTRGRSRVFKDKRKAAPPARKQIKQELEDTA